MATEFECKHEICVAPACICPRKEVDIAPITGELTDEDIEWAEEIIEKREEERD